MIGEVIEQEQAEPTGANDRVLQLFKNRGVVPDGCYLNGLLILVEFRLKADPCAGCNLDRERCGGRPKAKRPLW